MPAGLQLRHRAWWGWWLRRSGYCIRLFRATELLHLISELLNLGSNGSLEVFLAMGEACDSLAQRSHLLLLTGEAGSL